MCAEICCSTMLTWLSRMMLAVAVHELHCRSGIITTLLNKVQARRVRLSHVPGCTRTTSRGLSNDRDSSLVTTLYVSAPLPARPCSPSPRVFRVSFVFNLHCRQRRCPASCVGSSIAESCCCFRLRGVTRASRISHDSSNLDIFLLMRMTREQHVLRM